MDNNEEVITGDLGSAPRVLPPTGRHIAVLTKIILLGTIEESYLGKAKKLKKMVVGFELVNTSHVFSEEKGPQPFVHEQEFTQSMAPGATIRLLLEGWRGEKFSDKDAKAFNFAKLIGAPCELNLIKKVAAVSGKERIEVGAILQVREEEVIPALKNETLIFTIPSHSSDFNTEKFKKINKMYQNKIMSSDEYKALSAAPLAGGTATTLPQQGNVVATAKKPPF